MKYLLFTVFLSSALSAKSCPNCNIHNYLAGSIHSSSTIYIGMVVREKEGNDFFVEVSEVLKSDDTDPISIGDLKVKYLHSSQQIIGKKIVFSNPTSFGLNFPKLDIRHEWEVKYLIDTTREVSSVSEAIRLLECMSTTCDEDAREYIKKHYSESYDSLTARIIQFREICQSNEEDFYNEYRLTNLLFGLLIQKEERTKDFILNEISAISQSPNFQLTIDSLSYRGSTPISGYLKDILNLCQDQNFYELLVKKYVNHINRDSTSSIVYFSYALASQNLNFLDQLEITDKNKNYITLGIVSAALWNRAYYQRKKVPPLLDKIEALDPEENVKNFICVRFGDYLAKDDEEEPASKGRKSKGEKRKTKTKRKLIELK